MWTDAERTACVADLLARWLRAKVPASMVGRRNLRVVCAPQGIKPHLGKLLSSSTGIHWIVRETSDDDAVRLRHGRPDGVPDSPIAYVVLWSEGAVAADRNAQSLRDLPAFDVADVLGDMGFDVPIEQQIRARCVAAAQAWEPENRERAAQHVTAVWEGLRRALRLAPTKRQGGALRLVDSLDKWADFLDRCRVSDSEWDSWPPAERAERLLVRLGSSLPALGLFRLPALASVLGAITNPKEKPPTAKRSREDHWDEVLEELLAENAHWVADPGALAESLAGKKTLREQLDRLVRHGSVRLTASGSQDDAATALEQFCREYDASALEKIDWLFYEPPGNRRSKSMGLQGLFIARGRRESRTNPVEKLSADTVAALAAVPAAPDTCAAAVADNLGTPSGRQVIAAGLSELGGEGRRDLLPTWRDVVDKITPTLPSDHAQTFRDLAKRWREHDAKKRPDSETASTVLLALARLFRSRLGDASGNVGGQIRLTLSGEQSVSVTLDVDGSLSNKLREWIAGPVVQVFEDPDVTDDELNAREEDELVFEVARVKEGRADELGQIVVRWRASDRAVRRASVSTTPRYRERAIVAGESVPSGVALLRDAAAGNTRPGPSSPKVGEAWRSYVRSTGFEESGASRAWEIVDLIAPVGNTARALIDAWQADLEAAAASNGAEERDRRVAEITDEMARAAAAEDMPRVVQLGAELKSLKSQASSAAPTVSIDELRKLISIETYQLGGVDQTERVILTPHHPLVLRLRVLSDGLLSEIIGSLWNAVWPESGLEDLDSALDGWELPEPQHVFGAGPKEPLVFDGWSTGHAVYSRLGATRDADVTALGIASSRDVVSRFRRLFPSAADRLSLRVHGDDDCRWAWSLFGDPAASGVTAGDFDLVSGLPPRTLSAFEANALRSGDRLSMYEPGADGAMPTRRFRRLKSAPADDPEVHLSLLLADRLSQFKSSWADTNQ